MPPTAEAAEAADGFRRLRGGAVFGLRGASVVGLPVGSGRALRVHRRTGFACRLVGRAGFPARDTARAGMRRPGSTTDQ